jgi:hypothetical protein
MSNPRVLNTISNWYGRFGNNIQQICNGILFSETNGNGFFSPEHELIEKVFFNFCETCTINPNRFFHYNTQNKDFDIDLNFLYSNIKRICTQYIVPNLKFKVDESFADDTLVIHIRSGDIFQIEFNPPHVYTPNPLIYYKNLIKNFNNTIVVTENDNYNPIIDELKKYKNVSIQSSSVSNDFSTLMRAKNLSSSGIGTFAVAAALCSKNIKNFYCSDLYLTEHLNPEMLIPTNINVSMTVLENYIKSGEWNNSPKQRKFILEYEQ